MEKISVVIPTHATKSSRTEILKKVIVSLINQTAQKEHYEIIIVDDGSPLDLRVELKDFLDQKDTKISLLRQENKGPAAARNSGIRQATGEILLFLGDDTIADSNLLEEHMNMHAAHHNCVVNNPVISSPGIGAFAAYISEDYSGVEEGIEHEIGEKFGFSTACVSLKREWLIENMFDEEFKHPAHEDTELGIRLRKNGKKSVFTRDTKVRHEHGHDINSIVMRAKNCARGEIYIRKKHPDRDVFLWDIDKSARYRLKRVAYFFLYIFFRGILALIAPSMYAKVVYNYNWINAIEEAKCTDTKKP